MLALPIKRVHPVDKHGKKYMRSGDDKETGRVYYRRGKRERPEMG